MFKTFYQKLLSIIHADLFFVLSVSFVFRLCYYLMRSTTTYLPDTASYFNYPVNILKGQTDLWRTPGYPYFIKLIRWFDSNLIHTYRNIVIAQCLLSFLSIILFFKIAQKIIGNKKLVLIVALFYGICIPVFDFDKVIFSESFAISITIFFIYLLVRYLQSPSILNAFVVTFFIFIMIMTRPAFIVLIPVIIFFWCLRLLIVKNEKSKTITGLVTSLICIVLVEGYKMLNERNNQIRELTIAAIYNRFDIIINAGMYNNTDDPELSGAIAKVLKETPPAENHWPLRLKMRPWLTNQRIDQFNTQCLKNQPGKFLKYVTGVIKQESTKSIFISPYSRAKAGFKQKISNRLASLFYIPFFVVYALLAYYLVFFFAEWYNRRQVHWLKLILWLFVSGQLLIMIIGAQSEYQRIFIEAVPGVLILLVFFIQQMLLAIRHRKISYLFHQVSVNRELL